MEKRTQYIIIAIVVVVVLVLVFTGLTGQAIFPGERGTCVDSDEGDDKYVKGSCSYSNRDMVYTDYCFSRGTGPEKWLKEYYCLGMITSKIYLCDNDCVDGACIGEEDISGYKSAVT